MTNKPRGDEPPLTCVFGEVWLGPHPRCARYAHELCLQFEAAVARGEFDADGYTPAERRLQQLRAAART